MIQYHIAQATDKAQKRKQPSPLFPLIYGVICVMGGVALYWFLELLIALIS